MTEGRGVNLGSVKVGNSLLVTGPGNEIPCPTLLVIGASTELIPCPKLLVIDSIGAGGLRVREGELGGKS